MNLLKIHMMEAARLLFWSVLRWTVSALGPRTSLSLAASAGRVFAAVPLSKRTKLERGFRYLLGDGDHSEKIEKTFVNYALNSVEVFFYPALTPEKAREMVRYEGMDRVRAALARGKGIIFIHAHFGNEEFLMPALGFVDGLSVSQLATMKPPEKREGLAYKFPNFTRSYAYKHRIASREALPVKFIYVDRQGLRPAVRVLAENGALLMAGDGREGSSWVDVTFFGKPVSYSTGPIKLAAMTGATILPVFLWRNEDLTHTLSVEEPLETGAEGDMENNLKQGAQRFASILERHVRERPCHYAKIFWREGMYYFKDFTI